MIYYQFLKAKYEISKIYVYVLSPRHLGQRLLYKEKLT
jgi:hypothetical protein